MPADAADYLARLHVTDRAYLRVHPATARWWAQRRKCRACAHYVEAKPQRHGGGGERCRAVIVPILTGRATMEGIAYCIDARDLDGECEPNARLFRQEGGA